MKKRISAIAFVTAATVGLLGLPAMPADAGPPAHAKAHGKDCGFGQKHAAKAKAGQMGNGGHKPGRHRGATAC